MRVLPLGSLSRLTIGQKLLTSFGLLLVVLGLSLAGLLLYLSRVNSYVDRHQRITIPGVVTAAEMQQQVAHMSLLHHHLIEHPTDTARADRLNQLQSSAISVRTSLGVYRRQHAARTHPVLFSMLVSHGRQELASHEERALDAIAAGLDRLEAVRAFLAAQDTPSDGPEQHIDQTVTDIEAALSGLIDMHRNIDMEMKLEGDRLVQEAQMTALSLVLILGVLIVLTYIGMRTLVVHPLRQLAATADRVAHHDLTVHFEPWPSADEVGRLASSLTTMLTNLRDRSTALMRKTRELEAFTYSVAHDLKGPLREIEGFSSLLEKRFADSQDTEVRHHLEIIRRSALRLTSMIDALLKYSRLEQQTMPMSRFNVKEMVAHLVTERQPDGPDRKPKVMIELPFADLFGEPVSIRQALHNVLDNAVKFSRHAHQPEVIIGGSRSPHESIVWVRDNGIGIAPVDHERMFGLFERVHPSADYEGTGVGLAIVKLVMEKHQGRVWVESSPGQGATVFLAFPERPA